MSLREESPANLEDLVVEAQGGNRRALRQLLGDAVPKMHWWLKHPEDVRDDIISIVSTRLLEGDLQKYDPKKARKGFYSWLYRAVKNAEIDHFRALGTRRKLEEKSEETRASRYPSAERLLRREGSIRRLLHALSALDPLQRQALLLVHFEDLTQAEAAERLGVTTNTVNGWLTRGRLILKQKLLQQAGLSPPEKPEGMTERAFEELLAERESHALRRLLPNPSLTVSDQVLIGDYLRGVLSRRETAYVEGKLERNPAWQAQVDEIRYFDRVLREAAGRLSQETYRKLWAAP